MKVYIPFKRNNYSMVRITPFRDSILLSEAILIGLTVPFFPSMFNTTNGCTGQKWPGWCSYKKQSIAHSVSFQERYCFCKAVLHFFIYHRTIVPFKRTSIIVCYLTNTQLLLTIVKRYKKQTSPNIK